MTLDGRLLAERLGTFSLLASSVCSGDIAAFIAVQLVAAMRATGFFRWILEKWPSDG